MSTRVDAARAALRKASDELEKALQATSKTPYKGSGEAARWEQRAAEETGAWRRTYLAYAKCVREGGHHMFAMTNAHGGGFAGMRCRVCSYSEYN